MSLSNGNNGMGPADIAAVVGGGFGGMNGGWGNGGIWDILVLFLLFGLFGNGGFGGGNRCGANTTCATPADVSAAVDQQTLISKLDQQTYGLADATFALNNTMTTGFTNAELSRCNMQAAFMQQLYSMAADSAKCCCETQRLIERGFCDVGNAIHNSSRDITDNANCNTRAILDAINAQAIAAKDEKIAEQNQRIFSLELAASQAKQNSYLINEIRPCPVPAYITCNPYAASYGFGGWNNNGCGCSCA